MTSQWLDLKFMWFNAENLFLLSDQALTKEHLKLNESEWQKLSTSVFDNKPIEKCRKIAQIIKEQNPDIVMLCEIGGFESLKNFAHLFLDDSYSAALVEGNSNRNIDLGFLIRKGLPFYFDLVSNRNRLLQFLYPHERENLDVPNVGKDGKSASHKFSRDVNELHLFQNDREKPFLVILSTHLKSRLDPEGIDPQGFQRRQAELKALVEIYQETSQKTKNAIPIVLAGDFNGNASLKDTDPEFETLIKDTDLQDVGELAKMAQEQRATYFQVSRNSRTEGRQLDYCFLSPAAQKKLAPESVQFYRYRNHLGLEMDPPTSLDTKQSLPSDHYPIFFSLKAIVQI